MKKIILVVLIIIAVILGIFIVKNKTYDKFKETQNYQIEEISEYDYYVYTENEKFGVIDKQGKVVIQANYSKVVIPNPRKRRLYLL